MIVFYITVSRGANDDLTLKPEVVRPAFLLARTHFMRRKKVFSISMVCDPRSWS